MNTLVRVLLVLIAVIVVFVTFVFNLATYDCNFVKWDESNIPARCKHLESNNLAYIDTWERALIGTVLLLIAFLTAPFKRYRKVTMAVVVVGGAHLMIASGFCFKAYYLSVNYPGGACCYSTSLDSCIIADSESRCPMDWLHNGKVRYASDDSCLMKTCYKLYLRKSNLTACDNHANCTDTEVCSTVPDFKGCICKLNYGRPTPESDCTEILREGSPPVRNKLSGLNVFQSLLTISSTVVSIIMLLVLHFNIRNVDSGSFKYSAHSDPIDLAAKGGTGLAEVSTGKEERAHILIN